MGAGDYPAGVGPAGHDPVVDPSAPRDVQYPRALRFNITTRDHEMWPSGNFVESHPVDAWVVLQLGIVGRSISSYVDLGVDVRAALDETRSSAQVPAKVRDLVLRKLKPAIDRGDIAVESVTVETRHPSGATLYEVAYRNLRLDPSVEPIRVPLSPTPS